VGLRVGLTKEKAKSEKIWNKFEECSAILEYAFKKLSK
jgi:hypothetical protein